MTTNKQGRYFISWIKQYVLCLAERREVRLFEPSMKRARTTLPRKETPMDKFKTRKTIEVDF